MAFPNALTFLGVFELQKRSNPVVLSQMGCVAVLAGLMIGMLYFEEHYALGVWVGVLFVLGGLWLTNTKARSSKSIHQDHYLESNNLHPDSTLSSSQT